MQLTEEQQHIIFCDANEIYIIARAGTGKTTTLFEFTKQRPKLSFLYLAYNSGIKNQAYKKFFGNTEVHTIHSLAYKHIGHFYKDKLSEDFKLLDIIFGVDFLKEEYKKDKTNQELYSTANKVLNFLNTYFSSKYKELKDLENLVEEEIFKMSEEYFNKMQDFASEVKMTHEGYLKLFQLTDPELNYDYIMVDEAQDSNEVFFEIINNQTSKKIFVGDNYQSIYSFRNIINVFENIPENAAIFYLTKSFRFGSQISFFVNFFLKEYKNETTLIEGLGDNDSLCYLDDKDIKTVITRTNAHLFDLAVTATLEHKKIHIIGGENFIFNEMLDAMHLFKGELFKIKSFYIREFKSFARLKIIAEKTKDQELNFLVKVIEKYKENISFHIEKIKKSLVKQRNAQIVLTTTHKAKGLEFFNVQLSNDFVPLFSKNGHIISRNNINQEEINIYYVAMTRAIEKLEINLDLEKIISG